jgi:hypothetical protein
LTDFGSSHEEESVSSSDIPPSIVEIFDAMNAHDADRSASTVTPDIEIVIGPHIMNGVETIREFALQDDPELDVSLTPLSCHDDGNDLVVVIRRLSKWRNGDGPPVEEDSDWRFRLGDDGRISRVVIGRPS